MATAKFQNVALLAASGNLGSKILKSLGGAGYNVTAIQRTGSSKKVPEGIKSIQADLNSKSDLVSAFKGQDVVVSAVPDPQFTTEKIMIDACIEAGIKRLIPSEFSSNLEAKAKETQLPIVLEKLKIRKYLEEVAAAGKIEWSSINNGPFFDLGIQYGFLGPNIQRKTATYHDGGNIPVCTTSTFDIAAAVPKVLEHADTTRNRSNYIYSAAVTEQQMTRVVSKVTGIEFEVQHADVQKEAREYLELVKKAGGEVEGKDQWKKFSLYMLMMYGEGYGGDYRDVAANEALGLRVMDEKEIEESIRGWLGK